MFPACLNVFLRILCLGFFTIWGTTVNVLAGSREASGGECKSVIGAGHPTSAPFSWHDGQKLVGAIPEFISLIFGEFDIEFISRYQGSWKRVVALAEAGRLDVISTSKHSDINSEKVRLSVCVRSSPPSAA